jgi:sugar phosphate permease
MLFLQCARINMPCAGIPLSIIVKDYGWGAYFSTLVAACGMALLLLWPMTNLRSHVQREQLRAERARRLKGE